MNQFTNPEKSAITSPKSPFSSKLKMQQHYPTEAECLNTINEFKKDKTPGTEGFSAEFYKFFQPELRTEMLSRFHFAFQRGSLSISQGRGVISLTPKKRQRQILVKEFTTDLVNERRQ